MLKRILLPVLIVVGLLVAFVPRVMNANDDEMITDLETVLDVAWLELNNIETRDYAEIEDPILTIRYTTWEMDDLAYRAEMLEVFRLVGTVEDSAEMQIALVPQIEMGDSLQGLEMAIASMEMAQGLATGEMTRTDFLEDMQTMPLDHFSEGSRRPAVYRPGV